MNCYYLESDEVDHELTIRNLKGLDSDSDKRRELRRILREERHCPELVPIFTALDAQSELNICKQKVSELFELTKTNVRNISKHGEIYSRVLHVGSRLDRIDPRESSDSMVASREIVELLATCKGIKGHLKVKVPKEKTVIERDNHGRDSSTPNPEITNEGASTSRPANTVEEELRIANDLIKTLMSNLEIQKQKEKNPVSNHSSSDSDSGSRASSRRSHDDVYYEEHRDRSHRRVRDNTPFRGRQYVPVVNKGLRVSKWNLSFSGDPKGRTLSDFLNRIEHLSNAENVSEEELFRSGYHLFTGVALDWYIAFSKNYTSWPSLVRGLKKQFLPHDFEYWLLKDIEKRVQLPTESFGIYLAQMELMFRNLPYIMREAQKVEILRRNILSTYQERLALVEIESIEKLAELCRKIETSMFQVKRRGGVSFAEQEVSLPSPAVKSTLRSTSPSPQKSLYTPPSSPRRTFDREVTLRCYNCLEEGHHFNNCPKPRRLFCYKCGHQGVASPDCTRCRRASGNV